MAAADIPGISEKAVETRLYRGRAELAEIRSTWRQAQLAFMRFAEVSLVRADDVDPRAIR